jgi:hypothetical protein
MVNHVPGTRFDRDSMSLGYSVFRRNKSHRQRSGGGVGGCERGEPLKTWAPRYFAPLMLHDPHHGTCIAPLSMTYKLPSKLKEGTSYGEI